MLRKLTNIRLNDTELKLEGELPVLRKNQDVIPVSDGHFIPGITTWSIDAKDVKIRLSITLQDLVNAQDKPARFKFEGVTDQYEDVSGEVIIEALKSGIGDSAEILMLQGVGGLSISKQRIQHIIFDKIEEYECKTGRTANTLLLSRDKYLELMDTEREAFLHMPPIGAGYYDLKFNGLRIIEIEGNYKGIIQVN